MSTTAAHTPVSAESWRWGPEPDQHGVWVWPSSVPTPRPAVVLLHGGFWKQKWDYTLMLPLAHDLAQHGIACCSLEYRRRTPTEQGVAEATVSDALGGWSACLAHPRVRGEPVAIVGHSAGGTLALLIAALAPVPPAFVIAQATVADLRAADRQALSDEGDAVRMWIGASPEQAPDRWRDLEPGLRRPRCPVVMAHGRRDVDVPDMHSATYVTAHAKWADVRALSLPGDHYAIIDPDAQDWVPQRSLLLEALRCPPRAGP